MSRESLPRMVSGEGVSVQRGLFWGLCPEQSLSRDFPVEGSLSRGFMSGGLSVQEVSVQGSLSGGPLFKGVSIHILLSVHRGISV